LTFECHFIYLDFTGTDYDVIYISACLCLPIYLPTYLPTYQPIHPLARNLTSCRLTCADTASLLRC